MSANSHRTVTTVIHVAILAPLLLLAVSGLNGRGTLAEGQSRPDFSGEWTLISDKSDFGSRPAPATLTLSVVHKEPSLRITTVQTGAASGDLTFETSYSTDGKAHANTITSGTMMTTGKWDGAALVFTGEVSIRGMQFPIEDRFELSDGGKTLIRMRVVRHPRGVDETKFVFRKK